MVSPAPHQVPAVDICLVSMPYAGSRPSMALGLLHAVLERGQIAVESIYADLLFAEEVGPRAYGLVTHSRAADALGDWTFSRVAFPDFQPDDREFIERFYRRNRPFIDGDLEVFRGMACAIREAAELFTHELARRVLDRAPSMIGCSSTMQQNVSSLALLQYVRKLAPEVITLMGGANCETVMGRAIHRSFPWVDYVVSGEADEIIVPLVRAILQHGRIVEADGLPTGVFAPCHRLQGYPRAAGDGADEAPRATAGSLADQPVPNYDDYLGTLDACPTLRKTVSPVLAVETSRGCWWGQEHPCTFCGRIRRGRRFCSKPARQVIQELDTLHHRHGVSRFRPVDDCMDRDYFRSLFPELVRTGRSYHLFYESRADLTRHQVRMLRKSGVTWIQPGIESLHSRLLELMNKGCKGWQNVQLLKWCLTYGVSARYNLLCDLPGEEDRWYVEMAEWLPLLIHLQPPISVSRIRFDRYSRYCERPSDYGLRLRPAAMYSYVYPLAEDDLGDLVYFFEDEARVSDPLLTPLFSRPGIRAVCEGFLTWHRAFWSDHRPVLAMSVEDASIRIRDTRPVAESSCHTLTEIEGELYLGCDRAPRRRHLVDSFVKAGGLHSEIEAAIQSFLDRNLILELDGRLVALAVHESMVELPKRDEVPEGGMVCRTG